MKRTQFLMSNLLTLTLLAGLLGALFTPVAYAVDTPVTSNGADVAVGNTGTYQYQFDCGDAPDPTYPTLLASNGACHIFSPNVPGVLGAIVDLELDGQPTAAADGDDGTDQDDEDGVTFTSALVQGSTAGVDVVASAAGYLNAWLDWTGDGDWADAGEQIFSDQALVAGTNSLTFSVPAGAVAGTTYARFRYTVDDPQTELSYDGMWWLGGEVEDYQVTIQQMLDLGDYVWYDADQDGIQDAGEPGVQDIVVDLYQRVCTGQLIASTTTDANGNYLFQDLYPGIYCLQFSNIPAGWSISPQNQGADDTVDSDADPATAQITDINLQADDLDEDMGLYAEVSIGDWVWYDDNEDGIQDGTELGVPDVTVTLYHCDGDVQVDTTTTDANGLYRFNDVQSGRYYLAFVPPTGYEFTLQNQGSDAALDSDPDPATGETVCFSFDALQDDLTWDAGLYQPEPPPPPPPPPPPEEPPIVPEPSTLLLLGGAISGLAGYVGLQLRARRRR